MCIVAFAATLKQNSYQYYIIDWRFPHGPQSVGLEFGSWLVSKNISKMQVS